MDGLFLLLIQKVVVIISTSCDLSTLSSCLLAFFNALFIYTFDKIGHLFLALCTINLLCRLLTCTYRSLMFFLPLFLFVFYILLSALLVIFLFQLFSNRLSLVNDIKVWADKVIYRQLINVFLLRRLC